MDEKEMKRCVWQHAGALIVLKSALIGHFAMWAVRQSPYVAPDKLKEGLEQFKDSLHYAEEIPMTYNQIHAIVAGAIEESPIITSWNYPTNGKVTMIYTSRYWRVKPDYDFIDLDALSRNTVNSLWLELLYDDNVVIIPEARNDN